MELKTWFNQQIANQPPKPAHCELPSNFQIGDEIEILLDDADVPGFIYAVKFSSNGTLSYDIMVPIKDTHLYAIVNGARGAIRAKGSSQTAEELELIDAKELEKILTDALSKPKPKLTPIE